jgi:hypothetical protein
MILGHPDDIQLGCDIFSSTYALSFLISSIRTFLFTFWRSNLLITSIIIFLEIIVSAYTLSLLVFAIKGSRRGRKVWTSSVKEAHFIGPGFSSTEKSDLNYALPVIAQQHVVQSQSQTHQRYPVNVTSALTQPYVSPALSSHHTQPGAMLSPETSVSPSHPVSGTTYPQFPRQL